ncbi:MAG TPA: hypothetical protein VNN79_12335 [Actinomycetota bacterium]|nr:hypothetical protein [Actinomycetota bacterium]
MKRLIMFVAAVTSISTVLLNAPPAGATATGSNGPIAFRRYLNAAHTYGAIFTIEPDGTTLRQLTNPHRGVLTTDPDWSPDGAWVAYDRIVGDSSRIF